MVISRMRHETPEVKESILRNYDLIEVISNKGANLLYGVKVYKPKEKMEDS